jgi:ABC-type bacteriocin/lantibiotic exporter with double-glycine peptidase domain
MNIIYLLLWQFFEEEAVNIILTVLISFAINILQTNGISYITATIIHSLEKKQEDIANDFYKIFVVVSILFLILYHTYKYFQNKLMTKLRQWMRHQLVKTLLLNNNENFSEMNFTRLNSPINRISSVVFMVLNDIIAYLLPNVTFLILICAYFLYKNTLFGIGFILGNVFLWLYFWLNWQEMLKYNIAYEKGVNETESYLMDVLNNIDKIVYRGQVQEEISVFSEKTERSIHTAFQFYHNTNGHGSMMTFMMFVILFLSIGYLIFLLSKNKLNLVTFITFFTILLLYRDKMMTIIQQIPDFIEFMGRSDSVLKHFQRLDSVSSISTYRGDPEKEVSITSRLPFEKITFQNVGFNYTSGTKPVLENLSLEIDTRNNIIGITGLSGNGKSTFAKLLLKMYSPTSGEIYVDGVDIKKIDTKYLRENITYVNQNSKLFDKKIMENIYYGCIDPTKCTGHFEEIMKYPKVQELYRNVNMKSKQSGSLGENLSGGQRQMVNLIGGLVNPSPILILDEPTNALDPALKKEVIGLIRDFKKYKKSIIIISHDRDVFPLFGERIEI